MGKISAFILAPKFSPRNYVAQFEFGVFPAPCASSLGAVAGYCCAVVGGPSVRHVRSSCSLGSEKLVVVEDVCAVGSSAKKATFIDSWGALKFPASGGPAPKLEVCRNFPRRNCPQTKFSPLPPVQGGPQGTLLSDGPPLLWQLFCCQLPEGEGDQPTAATQPPTAIN